MRLNYRNKRGEQKSIELTEKALTIGRSADADVLILDEKASRVHCGIRFWDGDFYIKDLKSKNGTFVNDRAIDIHLLRVGDKIRVGSSIFVYEGDEETTGANTAVLKMQDEFDHGKGYSTILREIVDETAPEEAKAIATPQESEEPQPGSKDPTVDEAAQPPDASKRKPALRKRKLAASKKTAIRIKRSPSQDS
jgi:pSer/pThr/pTyr-binding forkhead associated (FHA) protein